MANTVHGYMSQSDKGEMVIGGGADGFNQLQPSADRSTMSRKPSVRWVETFPIISRLKMLRWWGGIVDMTGDRSPIISKTPVEGVFVNCGWGTGGFKAIPGSGWAMAELMAKGHSPLAEEIRHDPLPRGQVHRRKRGGGGGTLMAGTGTRRRACNPAHTAARNAPCKMPARRFVYDNGRSGRRRPTGVRRAGGRERREDSRTRCFPYFETAGWHGLLLETNPVLFRPPSPIATRTGRMWRCAGSAVPRRRAR